MTQTWKILFFNPNIVPIKLLAQICEELPILIVPQINLERFYIIDTYVKTQRKPWWQFWRKK